MIALPSLDLAPDRRLIDTELDNLLAPAERGPVQAAMRYAVFGSAQRVRPLLALRVARFLGASPREAVTAAAAVEMFHCASLIVDDLPCMDNDAMRRGRPATHVEFGEAPALLAAFGLVALAARSVVHLPKFQKRLLGVLDCNSLIAGQVHDLTDLKTVPLFEIAVQAGGSASLRFADHEHTLMRFAREFGLAFQLVDDYLDGELADANRALDQINSARSVAALLGDRAHELIELTDYLQDRLFA